MRLMAAHRILIVSAIVFFLGYAGWELVGRAGGRGTLGRATLAAAGAAALVLYFRTLRGR